MKELNAKLQTEKVRLSDQLTERRTKHDEQLHRIEQEKRKNQEEFQKILKQKESSFNQKMEKLLQQKLQSEQALEARIKEQTDALHKQSLKRQADSQKAERQIKEQLSSLEGILSRKNMDLNNLQSKNQEVENELAQEGQIREKLSEHIIYLQNEIRKRDELLEGGSEFGGDDDFALDETNSISEINMSATKMRAESFETSGNQSKVQNSSGAKNTLKDAQIQKPNRRTMGQILKN